MSSPPRANRGKRFRKSFRRKAGRFSKHFATTFEPPPTGVPRDHLRLPVPPGAGVQGLAISPCKQPSLIPGAQSKSEAQVWSRNTLQGGPDGPCGPDGHAAMAAKSASWCACSDGCRREKMLFPVAGFLKKYQKYAILTGML